MLQRRWTYSNSHGLTKWYGHVDYYDKYVIGQWFSLDAETGTEYWSRRFHRPTTVWDCAHDVIVASETRSDGPWTASFGIYGIDAQTGQLLWTNHGRGLWRKLLRFFDYVPGFTNEFRDVPKFIAGEYVVTSSDRILDIRTGRQCPSVAAKTPTDNDRSAPAQTLYDSKSLEIDGDTIFVQDHHDEFAILRRDQCGQDIWHFAAKDCSMHVEGNYYSYRLHDGRIFMILGDAPSYVPIKESEPLCVKPNPACYQLGVLDVTSGEFEIYPLANAKQRTECRIESIRNDRMLVSCDGSQLTEYKIAT